jgi:hypothetical protein
MSHRVVDLLNTAPLCVATLNPKANAQDVDAHVQHENTSVWKLMVGAKACYHIPQRKALRKHNPFGLCFFPHNEPSTYALFNVGNKTGTLGN